MAEEIQQQGAVQTETPTKTSKEIWSENIRNKYPDRSFENEDDLYAASMEGYDLDHEELKKRKGDDEKLTELLTANPDVAMFVKSLIDGDLWGGMAYLDDIKPRKEGDEGWEEYQKSVTDRKAKAEQLDKEIADYNTNMEASAAALKEFADENNMSEEEAVDFVKKIQSTIADKLFSGKIDKEFLSNFYKLFNYEGDIALAKKAGEIKGRNEKIDNMRRKQTATDGLPALGGAGGAKPEVETPKEESGTLKSLKALSRSKSDREKFF